MHEVLLIDGPCEGQLQTTSFAGHGYLPVFARQATAAMFSFAEELPVEVNSAYHYDVRVVPDFPELRYGVWLNSEEPLSYGDVLKRLFKGYKPRGV